MDTGWAAVFSHGFSPLQLWATSVTRSSDCYELDRSVTCRVFLRPKSLGGFILICIAIWQSLTCAATVTTATKLPESKAPFDWSQTRCLSKSVAYRKTRN